MNRPLLAAMYVVCFCCALSGAQPLTTAFTLQGELRDGAALAGPVVHLRLMLFDAPTGGFPVGPVQCANNVPLTQGRFTVQVDFGAQFAGQQRFLEVQARTDGPSDCTSAAGYTTLLPRQALTSAPNANFALTAASATTATSASTAATATNATQLNGQAASFYQNATNLTIGALPDARLSLNVGLLNSTQTITGAKTFSAAPSFTAAGAPFSVSNATLVTNLNADRLDGLDSTAFLQSVPVPLALSGNTSTQIIRGDNASNSLLSVGVYGSGVVGVQGSAPLLTGSTYGGLFQNSSTSGTAVWGAATAIGGITYGGNFRNSSTGGTAVYGAASALTGPTHGVFGQSDSTDGTAVYGSATAATGATIGGKFVTASESGYGVYGEATSNAVATAATGGYFRAAGTTGRGVWGEATSTTGITHGGVFVAHSSDGFGVLGQSNAVNNTGYGVYGGDSSANGFGLYAGGNFGANGTKSFRIDHPDDPANKYLLHYCAESPDVINFYSGKITLDERGQALVTLPAYFAKINKDPRYQLTPIGAAMPLLHIAEEVNEDSLALGAKAEPGDAAPVCSFVIAGGAPNGKVSWEVKALRNDRWVQMRGAPVEVDKRGPEKGTYQHPDLYGQPPERGMIYDLRQRASRAGEKETSR